MRAELRIYYVYAALAKAILRSAKSIYATAVGRVGVKKCGMMGGRDLGTRLD